jgi:hypothetical protein
MDIVVWLIVNVLFSILQDCGMHCYVRHTLSVTHYVFMLLFPCWQTWQGRAKLFNMPAMCAVMYVQQLLCA